jgi:hypothetical protein
MRFESRGDTAKASANGFNREFENNHRRGPSKEGNDVTRDSLHKDHEEDNHDECTNCQGCFQWLSRLGALHH